LELIFRIRIIAAKRRKEHKDFISI